jgi:uncharacterized protein (UPF0332 family)
MTTREMTTLEHARTAREFLVASDREFAVGDHLQAAEKLYGAANHAVTAVAQQRGWQYESHRVIKNAIYQLSRDTGDLSFIAAFTTAEKFHKHFFHDNMEPYELDGERPVVHEFVGRVLSMLDAAADKAEV